MLGEGRGGGGKGRGCMPPSRFCHTPPGGVVPPRKVGGQGGQLGRGVGKGVRGAGGGGGVGGAGQGGGRGRQTFGNGAWRRGVTSASHVKNQGFKPQALHRRNWKHAHILQTCPGQ